MDEITSYLQGRELSFFKNNALESATDIQRSVKGDVDLCNFLLSTASVTSPNISTFINLNQSVFEYNISNPEIFADWLIHGDTAFVNSFLQDREINIDYFEFLMHLLTEYAKSSKKILMSKCVHQILKNFEYVNDTQKDKIKKAIEPLMCDQNIVDYMNSFEEIETLKDFTENSVLYFLINLLLQNY